MSLKRKQLFQTHSPALVILLAFISLATLYSIYTPPFEAGDESRHYAVIKYIVDTGQLPIQNIPETAALQHHWSHEGNQPPLYYGLAALLTGWIDVGGWDDVFWYNPHTSIGDPLRLDNKNITIHPPAEPQTHYFLAVRLIRFLSISMAAVTVFAAYLIALTLFEGNRWLASGALVITAFNPMFIFISASINNDNAVIMFITLALWLMVGFIKQTKIQATISSPHLKHLILLGILIGLGALSKLYAFGLLPVAGLLFIWLAYRAEQENLPEQMTFSQAIRTTLKTPSFWRNVIVWNVTVIIVVLAVAGWFYLRNATLYDGDFLAIEVMRDTAGQRDEIPSLATIRTEFQGFRIAYWALFGGVNILADPWIYPILDWVSLISVIGVLIFIIGAIVYPPPSLHHKHQSPNLPISLPTFTLLLLWYLIMIAGFIVWNLTQPAGQGRLMYPAIAAISALGIWGLTWWLSPSLQKIVVVSCGLALFLFALISPFRYIAPAYASPPILSQAELPADLQTVDFVYNGKVRLIGYQLPMDTIRPAEKLPLTLYWQLLAPTALDYSLFIHLLGRQRQVIGQVDTYPGGGKWPTTLLQPGDIVADYYEVPIKPAAEFDHAPTRILITAGIYDLNEAGRPGKPAINQAGQPVEPVIAQAKLVPWQWPTLALDQPGINFFDKATLLKYTLAPDQQTLTLYWEAQQNFTKDYTVFIQAWRQDTQEYVLGFDGPPVQNDYPTSLWQANEQIIDHHPLDLTRLEPGEYYLLAGLYDPATGERLPAFGPEGPLPDYAVNVGTLHITE